MPDQLPDDFESFMQSRMQPAPTPGLPASATGSIPAAPGNDFDSFMQTRVQSPSAPATPKPASAQTAPAAASAQETWAFNPNAETWTGPGGKTADGSATPAPAVHPALAGLPQPDEALRNASLNADQVVERLSAEGRKMRASALAKLPHPFETSQDYPATNVGAPGYMGIPQTPPTPGLDPAAAGQQAAAGVVQMSRPGMDEKLRGAGNAFVGGVTAAAPLMVSGAATAPLISTIRYLGLGWALQHAAHDIGKAAGLNEQDATELGEVAGAAPIAVGAVTQGVRAAAGMRAGVANEIARKWQAFGDTQEAGRAEAGAGADPIHVTLKSPQGPLAAAIRFNGLSPEGRPFYSVTASGAAKPIITGTGESITSFLGQRAADPTLVQKWNQSLGAADASGPGGKITAPSMQAATKLIQNEKVLADFSAQKVPPAERDLVMTPNEEDFVQQVGAQIEQQAKNPAPLAGVDLHNYNKNVAKAAAIAARVKAAEALPAEPTGKEAIPLKPDENATTDQERVGTPGLSLAELDTLAAQAGGRPGLSFDPATKTFAPYRPIPEIPKGFVPETIAETIPAAASQTPGGVSVPSTTGAMTANAPLSAPPQTAAPGAAPQTAAALNGAPAPGTGQRTPIANGAPGDSVQNPVPPDKSADALAWVQAQPKDAKISISSIQRQFRLGYGAAQTVLVQGRPAEHAAPLAPEVVAGRIAPQLQRIDGRPEWSLGIPFQTAIAAMAKNQAPADLEARALANTLAQPPEVAEKAFKQYADLADQSREGAPAGLYEPATRDEAFQGAFGRFDGRNSPYSKPAVSTAAAPEIPPGFVPETPAQTAAADATAAAPKPESTKAVKTESQKGNTATDDKLNVLPVGRAVDAQEESGGAGEKGNGAGPIHSAAASREPAAQPGASAAAQSGKEQVKPKPSKKKLIEERLAKRRGVYTPGNVVTGYGGMHDKVVAYHEKPDGTFRVDVREVRKNGEFGTLRRHSTEPDRQAKIISRSPEAESDAGESLQSRAVRGNGFYSQLERTIEAKIPNKVSPTQARAILNNPQNGVKADELKWTGLNDWLATKTEPLSKQEILDYAQANAVQVEETGFIQGHARYQDYTLPGGKKHEANYKELLFTLPVQRPAETAWKKNSYELDAKYGPNAYSRGTLTAEERERHGRLTDAMDAENNGADSPLNYKSPHFEKTNILAHARITSRTDADGTKVLMIEEIQSDWHQAGRQHGYREEESPPSWTRVDTSTKSVPPAPFAKNWHEFVFRRMLRYAAANGYDKIAWTTGAQQAARFDLAKHVSGVAWQPSTGELYIRKRGAADYEPKPLEKNVTAGDLADYVGKDGAGKMAAIPPDESGYIKLEGKSLQVGGHGMSGFYDQILPQYASKYGRKWGAQPGQTNLVSAPNPNPKSKAKPAAPDHFEGKQYHAVFLRGEENTYGGYYAKEAEYRFGREPAINVMLVGDVPITQTGLIRSARGTTLYLRKSGPSRSVQLHTVMTPEESQAFIDGVHEQYLAHLRSQAVLTNSGAPKTAAGPRTLAVVHSLDITPAMRESVMREGQPLFNRAALRPVDPTGDVFAQGDARFVKGKLYVNSAGMATLSALDDISRGLTAGDEPSEAPSGWTLSAPAVDRLVDEISFSMGNPELPLEYRQALDRIGSALLRARVAKGETLPVVGVDAGDSAHFIRRIVREELFHQAQFALQGNGRVKDHIPARAFFANEHAARAAEVLKSPAIGYPDDPDVLAAEVPAWLAAGAYAKLRLSRAEALDALAHYFTLLRKQWGDKTASVLARVRPDLRKELLEHGRIRETAGGAPGETRSGGAISYPGRERGNRDADRSERSGLESRSAAQAGVSRKPIPQRRQGSAREGIPGTAPGDEEDLGAPQRHYSALGHLETKLARNLSELRRASAPAFLSAIDAASARSKASVLLHTVNPLIAKALGKDPLIANRPPPASATGGSRYAQRAAFAAQAGITPIDDFYRAGAESRLLGRQEFYRDNAQLVATMPDSWIEKNVYDSFIPLFQKIQDRRGLGRDLAQTITALAAHKDWPSVRALAEQSFEDAADAVTHVMTPDEFDQVRHHPNFPEALRIYKDRLEAPMAAIHAEHEGVFTSHVGPLSAYFPLTPAKPEKPRLGSAGPAYGRPDNRFNNFATGMADAYDWSMAALETRLYAAIRAGGRAALADTLKFVGLEQPQSAGLGPDGDYIQYNGVAYHAVKRRIDDHKMIVKDGKVAHVPPRDVLLPRWLVGETDPILDKSKDRELPAPTLQEVFGKIRGQGKFDLHDVGAILDAANTAAVTGLGEPIWHGMNLMGTIVANTPFLDNTLPGKALSVPMLKMLAAPFYLLHQRADTEESAEDLMEMAKLGMVSDHFARTTFSRQYAALTNAQRTWWSLAPALWGPSGIDTRARLFMYRLAKKIYPPGDEAGMHLFVNQLGIYSRPLQSHLEQALKGNALGRLASPFVTAGLGMNRNAANNVLMASRGPRNAATLAWHLVNSAATLAFIGAAIQRLATGRWPWQDPASRLLEIPIHRDSLSSPAAQKLYHALYGNAPVGMVKLNLFNPLAGRGIRELGVKGAADTKILGGAWWQSFESAERDVLNSAAHPFLGPIPRAAMVGLTGKELYANSLYDDKDEFRPSLMNASRNKGGNRYAKRALSTAKTLNTFVGGGAGDLATGAFPELFGKPPESQGNAWARMLFDIATPGLVGAASSPETSQYFLEKARHWQALRAARGQ